MKYAKLVKLGGELIEAKDADYQDYYGILTCSECGEPVFLRKGHQRGDTVFRAAFVHHKAIPEVSACEMRVGKYSPEYVARVAGEARNQRLRMLEISMWKYLKTTKAIIGMHQWSQADKMIKSSEKEKYMSQYIETLIQEPASLPHYIKIFDSRQKQMIEMNKIEGDGTLAFVKSKQRDWELHQRIAKEALTVFASSASLIEIRGRFSRILSLRQLRQRFGPELTTSVPDFKLWYWEGIEWSDRQIEWLQKFMNYVAFMMVSVFLTVDWIEVLNVNKEETRKTRGFAPVSKG